METGSDPMAEAEAEMTRKNQKTERNDELLRDYAQGHGRKYLARKYNLSQTRVRSIIDLYYLKNKKEINNVSK